MGRHSLAAIRTFVAGLVILQFAIFVRADDRASGAIAGKQPLRADVRGVRLSGAVQNEDGIPIAGARIRVVVGVADMRFVDESSGQKLFETTCDAKGQYSLDLTGIEKPTKVSIDAMFPSYERLCGTLAAGGDARQVEVAPGRVSEAKLKLRGPALYFAGQVVDEKGKPIAGVQIAADEVTDVSSAGIERITSGQDGSFEVFGYPKEPFPEKDRQGKLLVTRGRLVFFHENYVEHQIADVYKLPQDERTALRIVLSKGRKIAGTLVDNSGKPVSDVMVKAIGGSTRKATLTDARGAFRLSGLPSGQITLSASAFDINQKIQLPMALDSDQPALKVQLRPIPMRGDLETYEVLGMRLTDLTQELKAGYDIGIDRGAVILDPGKNSDRLKIGELAKGYCFWMVGNRWVGNVRAFVSQVLSEAAFQKSDEVRVRVVYTFRNLEMDGTNTQYLALTKEDIKELESVLDRFRASEQQAIAELRRAGADIQFEQQRNGRAADRVVGGPQVRSVFIGKQWKGSDADFSKLSQVGTLDGKYVKVLSSARVSEKAIAQLQSSSPGIGVARTNEGSLGILLETKEGAPPLKIDEVLPGSPAERGGLQKGDRVLELNGKPVHDFGELSKSVRTLKPGQKAAIKLLRDGKEKNVTVEFGGWK
jgi:hypothetical protein